MSDSRERQLKQEEWFFWDVMRMLTGQLSQKYKISFDVSRNWNYEEIWKYFLSALFTVNEVSDKMINRLKEEKDRFNSIEFFTVPYSFTPTLFESALEFYPNHKNFAVNKLYPYVDAVLQHFLDMAFCMESTEWIYFKRKHLQRILYADLRKVYRGLVSSPKSYIYNDFYIERFDNDLFRLDIADSYNTILPNLKMVSLTESEENEISRIVGDSIEKTDDDAFDRFYTDRDIVYYEAKSLRTVVKLCKAIQVQYISN